MPEIKPEAIIIFNEYSSAINKCRKELAAQKWFKGDWWINVDFSARGYTFQLSRTSWHNHNGQGIHFEFWIEENEHTSKTIPLVLHFEPETPNRKKLGDKFKKAMLNKESEYSDYTINYGALCDKMQKKEKITKSGLHKIVVKEFSRLQELGPLIDKILS